MCLNVELEEEDPFEEEEQKEEDATLLIDVVSLEVLLNTPALRSNNDGTEQQSMVALNTKRVLS